MAAAGRQPVNPGASDDAGAIHTKDGERFKPSLVLQSSVNGMAKHAARTAHSSSNSAVSSREASPIRPFFRTINSSSTSRSVSRSRKNSEDSSLSRNASDASINNLQRKLSNVNKPHLPPPSSDNTSESRVSRKSMPTKFGEPSLHWPTSPRLRSPPPTSPKPQEVEVAANTPQRRQHSPNSGDTGMRQDDEEARSRPPRGVTRGASTGSVLETVQEAGTPVSQAPSNPPGTESGSETPTPKPVKSPPESGSDSGGTNKAKHKDNQRVLSTHKPGDVISKRSFTSLNSRGKPGESSLKNMIVETETVSSIPQLALGVGAVDRIGSGRKESGSQLRMKASDETIRPKKEKKRQSRKATIPSGTVSSKADIFEAKVASAVDDADTSDSDETFVYESNPDAYPQRQRYHSRTPSVTSMASQIEYGGRVRLPAMREVSQGVTGKRSMKFTNNTYNLDGDGDDASAGRGSSRASRHYHNSRPGRKGAHLSLLDQSPFAAHGSKSPRHMIGKGHRQSRSNSPRVAHHYRTFKNDDDAYGYDYDAEGADDERTPLVGMGRRNRRRPNSASLRQMEYIAHKRRSWFSRYGFCVILLILFLTLVGGATTFVVGISKSMMNLQIREIQNVLASEQELMLDLDVEAINPNLIPITISDMDVNIFARSRYVGDNNFWRDQGPHPEPLPRTIDSRRRAIRARSLRDDAGSTASGLIPRDGVDKGTDPMPEDPAGDPQTMLLGRIFHFASPLTFEPSAWKHEASHSIGQVRLMKPGNKTEEGGSIRWERVMQHPFDLIVRGIVKYQLPLGSRAHSASINSMIRVLPDNDTVPDTGGVPPPPVDGDYESDGEDGDDFHITHDFDLAG